MRAFLISTVAVLALAGGVSAASLPGTKTAHDRAAWRALLHWPAACERDWRATRTPGAGMDVTAAGSSGQLVTVDCELAAYQGVAVFFLVTPAREVIGPLRLQIYGDPGNGRPTLSRQTEILGVSSFARSTHTLTVLDKFRGLGDCGIYSTFRLQGDRFVLVEARAKTACNGKPPSDAAHWPRLAVPKS